MTGVYEFIDAQYATSPAAPAISCMCAWLEVSKSGFYEWRTRPESAAAKRRRQTQHRRRRATVTLHLGLLVRVLNHHGS